MLMLTDAFDAIRGFMERGGDVLYLLLVVTFIMWVLIIERLWYLTAEYRKERNRVIDAWEARSERKSWYAHKIRIAMISEISANLNNGIPLMVALCPLIGLLGTVTGMVSVFDVMAFQGSGNARAMASGVSKATIPTMSGMVAALSGVFLVTILTRTAHRRVTLLEDDLTMDH